MRRIRENMTKHTAKLNLASFDYYLLKINPEIKLEQVENKLASLRQFDENGRYIAVEILTQFPIDALTNILISLKSITDKYKFELKFILANKFVTSGNIADLPVLAVNPTFNTKEFIAPPVLISDPIRSGIKVEHEGDIIIVNLVSNNAEIIAGGNIHIYGDARGRLIAGRNGDKTARIFVQKFNAELISIAGIFRVLEDKLPQNLHNKAVQVFLDDKERLNIIPL